VELDDRCKLANRWEADFFVSVHLNSNGPDASGIETLYASAAGRELAMPVQIALVAATGEKDRGVKERNDLYVLNGTDMPAILVEVGFISHPATEAKVKSQSYRDTLAAAIAEGIADYLGLDDEEPASV
jgi:N-acetylmuramoyl-L-alanine amidase